MDGEQEEREEDGGVQAVGGHGAGGRGPHAAHDSGHNSSQLFTLRVRWSQFESFEVNWRTLEVGNTKAVSAGRRKGSWVVFLHFQFGANLSSVKFQFSF